MRPVLPKKPTRDVDKITASWLCRLLDCVEWAMNYPKGDGKTTYRDGESIKALRQPGGAFVGTVADTYNGYFKVIQTAENKIKIVDGFDYDASACGTALINDTEFNISSSEFTITANSWIYLITHYDEDDEVIVNDGLQAFTSQQSFEYDKSKVLISRVEFSSSAITDFSQEQYGPIRDFIGGDCSGAVLV